MIKYQNFVVNVNVQSVHYQLQAPTQVFSLLLLCLSQPCRSVLETAQTAFNIYTQMTPIYDAIWASVVMLYGCVIFFAPQKVGGCPYRYDI